MIKMKYIKNVETLEELKKAYKKLALKLHPDCGGNEEEIGTNFGEDILRMYGNIDIEKAKEYQDIVEEYYPIETIVY